MAKTRPYRCPGCDREAHVYVTRTTMHTFGNGGLVYSISCRRHDDLAFSSGGRLPNSCLGEWFAIRPFETETSAVSAWNDAIIDMAASALEITSRQARAIKERRAALTEGKDE